LARAEDLARLQERVRRSRRYRMAAYLIGHLSALVIGTIAIGPPGGSSQYGDRLLVEFVVFGIVPLIVGSSCEWFVNHLRGPTVRSYLGALLPRQGRLTFRIEEHKSTRLGEILGWLALVAALLLVLSGGPGQPLLLLLVLLLLTVTAAGSFWVTDSRLGLIRRPFEQLDASPDGLDWWGPDGRHERLRLVDVRRVVTKRGLRGGRTEITTWTGERREIPSSYIEPDAEEPVDLQTVIEILRPGVFRRSLRLSLLDAITDVAEAGPVQG
jgi:hypothetical protein